MKKVIPIIIFIVLILGLSLIFIPNSKDIKTKKKNKVKYTNLLDLEEYKDLKLENIAYMEETHYTEGGEDTKKIDDTEEITRMYNMIKNIKLKKETEITCEDNSTVYRFYMNNNKQINIVFECEVLVTKNKRYLVKE